MSGVSIREQILRAVVVALGGEGSPAASVFRSKLDQITTSEDDSQLPCFDVTPGEEREDASYQDHDAWGRILSVVVRAIVDATDADDGALDPLFVFATQVLSTDGDLQALVNDWSWIDGAPVFRPEGRDLIGMELTFEFKFAVTRGDVTQKG